MWLPSSTCITVAISPFVFVDTLGGAPRFVIVVYGGTRVVLLPLVHERKDATRAFSGAAASFWIENFSQPRKGETT